MTGEGASFEAAVKVSSLITHGAVNNATPSTLTSFGFTVFLIAGHGNDALPFVVFARAAFESGFRSKPISTAAVSIERNQIAMKSAIHRSARLT
jgi:hypothetical protein